MAETADGVEKTDGAVSNEQLAAIVASLAEAVKEIASRPPVTERVQQVYTQGPGEMPIARTTDEVLRGLRGMQRGEARSGVDYTGPPGRRRKFRDNDLVELISVPHAGSLFLLRCYNYNKGLDNLWAIHDV